MASKSKAVHQLSTLWGSKVQSEPLNVTQRVAMSNIIRNYQADQWVKQTPR